MLRKYLKITHLLDRLNNYPQQMACQRLMLSSRYFLTFYFDVQSLLISDNIEEMMHPNWNSVLKKEHVPQLDIFSFA